MSDDQKRRPGPVKKKPAGVSRRLVRGRWVEASADTSMFAALIRAITKNDQQQKEKS